MANLSVKTGTISRSMLVGNPPFIPTSFESIATAVGTGSSGSITFSSIPQTYKHLQIRYIAKTTFGPGFAAYYALSLTFNGDTGSNYSSHRLVNEVNTAYAYAQANQTEITNLAFMTPSPTFLNNIMGAGIIDIADYQSTTKNKTVRAFSGVDSNSSTTDQTGSINIGSGLWRNTNAITSITINPFQNFTTTSVFSLYGIKG
jgi:hypothetical protein